MIPTISFDERSENVSLKNAVSVADVTGGSSTNPLWVSQVSSSAFRDALEQSLQRAGIFNQMVAAGKYQLTADLLSLAQPLVGLDLTVTASVRYDLIEAASRKSLYSKTITLPYTARMGDAFMAAERLQLANEGAIRVNIEALLRDLLQLKP
jgi:hypothetical protein